MFISFTPDLPYTYLLTYPFLLTLSTIPNLSTPLTPLALPILPTLPYLLPHPIYVLYIRIRPTNLTYLYDLRILPRLAKAANLRLPPSLCSASLNLDLSPCGLRHQGSDHLSLAACSIYVYVLRIYIRIRITYKYMYTFFYFDFK